MSLSPVNGRRVARLVPIDQGRRRWIPRAELISRLQRHPADAALRQDLIALAGDTTDDLGPIR